MTYLLDTNAISDLMRSSPRIENWMEKLDPADRVVTCPIVRGELLFGIARLPHGRRRTELEKFAIGSYPSCIANGAGAGR